MPLLNGDSKQVVGENIKEMRRAGHSEAQSVAAASSIPASTRARRSTRAPTCISAARTRRWTSGDQNPLFMAHYQTARAQGMPEGDAVRHALMKSQQAQQAPAVAAPAAPPPMPATGMPVTAGAPAPNQPIPGAPGMPPAPGAAAMPGPKVPPQSQYETAMMSGAK